MNASLRRLPPWLCVLACLLPFLPGLGGPFLLDDEANLRNLLVGPLSLQGAVDAALRNPTGPLHRPLSNLSFAADLWLHGRTPFGFKVVNLLLHGACGLALLAFGRALLAGLWPQASPARRNAVALLAAMLWTVHPLQASTALYVVQRMAQLSTLFLLLLAWQFQRYLNRGDASTRAALRFLPRWAVLVLLAVASKENGALAPLLMAVQWGMHRTVNRGQPRPPAWLPGVSIALPLLLGVLAFALRPDFVLGGYAGRDFTLPQRLLTEAVVLWHYLRLWFIPWIPWMGLYNDLPTFGVGDWGGWAAIAAWLAVLAGAWHWRRRYPLAAFAALWFLAAHAMESTVLPLELVYEHRNYLALPGIALLSASAIVRLSERLRIHAALAAAAAIVLLAGATLQRAHDWSSPQLFAASEYAHHPRSDRAATQLLALYVANGDVAATASMRRRIHALDPDASWPLALDLSIRCSQPETPVQWDTLARRIHRDGTDAATMKMLRQAAINMIEGKCPHLDRPRLARLLETAYARALADGNGNQVESFGSYLGWMASSQGDTARAARWMRRTAKEAPGAVEVLFDLAYLELNRGRPEAAADAVAELRRRQPGHRLVGYRIDELDAQVTQARMAAAPSPGTAPAPGKRAP
ncbi:hypothetical protein MQC88_07060 [Luteimonas sp. 50]|uniref:Tetratricopeptide repeat protein n=1 Tax=Cognatiluteimonas sedimenti TaxID=2927791 RepID=A0ABT0A408_9GAMM|nr:hypothetical protein [Lysobacter sedimenti]MCJ0825714.1 hypothetical protein [Lysobacter sedimenti]